MDLNRHPQLKYCRTVVTVWMETAGPALLQPQLKVLHLLGDIFMKSDKILAASHCVYVKP